MGRYPLEQLLAARRYREDAAAREAVRAERLLEAAIEAETAAREEARRYHEWRPGEEARLFKELQGKVIPLSGLDRHREDIEALHRTELALEEAAREAEKAVSTRTAEVKEAKRLHMIAIRERQKIDAHRDLWLREEAKRVAQAEEAELEDFSVHPDDNMGDMET